MSVVLVCRCCVDPRESGHFAQHGLPVYNGIYAARRKGAKLPFAANTSYVNTIPPEQQPKHPGDRKLEMTILPEKAISPLERHQLIYKAHEQLVEIDKRNAVQFGDLLKSLSEELGK